ncbi:peptidylprolyl isomerase [Plastorhodobacter daqingensis]|uniref:Parvulin-like PPIase n=1 Tax=Plastorhodobacter daqingensis TaxID=1387281 RepID=A0ABW2UK10_9RHOB
MRLTMLFTAALLALTPLPGAAQGLFQTRAQVNDRIVTGYEVSQRAMFLEVLNTAGDLQQQALDALIEDRLRQDAAARLGITLTEAQLEAGMAEFAGRANMSTEEFVAALGQTGIAEETFSDFVAAGMLWREVVRARFAQRASTSVTEADIDRALSASSQRGAVRVLLSEIILPATPEFIEQTAPLAEEISQLRGSAFADAARQFSAAQSREQGGQIDWLPLANLPPEIGAMFLTMQPGDVTPPITLGNAIAIFQLRALEETRSTDPSAVEVEYARFLIPGTGAAAQTLVAQIAAQVDSCVDLNRPAVGLSPGQVVVTSQTVAQLPQDIGMELARLDANEISSSLTQGNDTLVLMLCHRRPILPEPPSRDAVREQIINQRLNGYADILMDELRADAFIRLQ